MVLAGVCWFFFFFGLNAFGLVGADEPRYAQIAREMLARHDWVVTTLNGAPWLEKPPLLYWGEMISYSIFGVHDWVARIPSGIFASGLVLCAFFFMRRFREGSELDAALITTSCAAVLGFARGASTDMPLSASFCAAMLAWWAWHETGKKLWLGAFYALLALGTLAKGPIAPALAVLIIAAYAWLRRDAEIFRNSLWVRGFVLFFAIALPWYIAIQIRVPQFFHAFFIEQNLARFGTDLYRHSRPFWYYVPVLLLSVLPWIVFALPALWQAFRDLWKAFRREGETVPAENDDGLTQFLALWILIPIVFFSISRSKLPGYILPAIPPVALLTAAYLQKLKAVPRFPLMLHSLVCGVVLAGAFLAPWIMLRQPVPEITRTIVAVMAGVAAIVVLVMVRRGGLRRLNFATLIPMVIALAFLLRPAGPSIDQAQSARALEAELRQLGVASDPIAVLDLRNAEYGLNFYLNKPIVHYQKGGPIPLETHVVLARQGSYNAVQAIAGQRPVVKLADFPPQRLEFFLVSNQSKQ